MNQDLLDNNQGRALQELELTNESSLNYVLKQSIKEEEVVFATLSADSDQIDGIIVYLEPAADITDDSDYQFEVLLKLYDNKMTAELKFKDPGLISTGSESDILVIKIKQLRDK